MNDQQIIELLASGDAYAPATPLPDSIWSAEVMVRVVESRTGITAGTTDGDVVGPRRGPSRVRGIAVAVAAFAVVILAGVIVWATIAGDSGGDVVDVPTTTAPPPPTTAPAPPTTAAAPATTQPAPPTSRAAPSTTVAPTTTVAVDPELRTAITVAEAFMGARAARDGEAQAALLAPDAEIDDFEPGGETPADYPAIAALHEAIGYTVTVDACPATRDAATGDVVVTCEYTFENIFTRASGTTENATIQFVIADGVITKLFNDLDGRGYGWTAVDSFLAWLEFTHPDAVDVIFLWGPEVGGIRSLLGFGLSPEAIDLLAAYSVEYAEERG